MRIVSGSSIFLTSLVAMSMAAPLSPNMRSAYPEGPRVPSTGRFTSRKPSESLDPSLYENKSPDEQRILPIETPIDLPGLDLDPLQNINVPIIVQPDEEQRAHAPDTLGIVPTLVTRASRLEINPPMMAPEPVASVVANLPIPIPIPQITVTPSNMNVPMPIPFDKLPGMPYFGKGPPKSKDSGSGLPKLPDATYLPIPSGNPVKESPNIKLPLPILQNKEARDVPDLPLASPAPSEDEESMDNDQDLDWCDSYDDNGFWYNGEYHEWYYDAEQ